MPALPAVAPPVTTDIVTIDGIAIHTAVVEPVGASRGDVVFCHGTPWSSTVWQHAAQAVRDDFRVHLWDMPGYGASISAVDGPLDLASQSARLAALLEHRGLRHPHVVAHDIGGAVALGARLDSGRSFASLLLLDVVLLDPWGSDFFRLVADNEGVFGAVPEPLHTALVRAYIEGAPRRALDAAVIDALVQSWRGANGRRAFVRQIGALAHDGARTRELVGRLGEVDEPVLVAWGADDPWIPVEQAERLAASFPRSRAPVLFEGCGHLVPLESPTAFGRVLRRWLGADAAPPVRRGTIAQA